MNKTFVNMAHGAVMAVIVSLVLFGPPILGWAW
jgi:hypothetical protein